MRLTNKLGMLLLGIWLLATGLLALISALNFAGAGNILALLAIVAGVLVLLER